jgi:hypothetical protein
MTDRSETLFERSLKAERELLSSSAISALAEEHWTFRARSWIGRCWFCSSSP